MVFDGLGRDLAFGNFLCYQRAMPISLYATYFGNTIQEWGVALGIFLGSLLLLLFLRSFLRKKEGRGFSRLWKFRVPLHVIFRRTSFWSLLVFALFFATLWLSLEPNVKKIAVHAAYLVLLAQIFIWVNDVLSFFANEQLVKRAEEKTVATAVNLITFVAKSLVLIFISLLALDHLGVQVTTLVAGLGVGGIAIALAVQNILGDLFASLTIVLDKPFVVGDFLIIDNYMGNVERVGLKTTRIKSLSGEQLVFPNSDLLKSRIKNYRKMEERRVLFTFGVLYQTSSDQLKEIPQIVKTIVEAQDKTRFDRAHFKNYGESSLDFEVVYYVSGNDYGLYMDIQQQINLEIFQAFEKKGINFAYPTRTVYMHQEVSSDAERPI
jgi:small-conductance mechanosensitive channel